MLSKRDFFSKVYSTNKMDFGGLNKATMPEKWNFTWTIRNFPEVYDLSDRNTVLKSTQFSKEKNCDVVFYMEMIPRSTDRSGREYIMLIVYMVSTWNIGFKRYRVTCSITDHEETKKTTEMRIHQQKVNFQTFAQCSELLDESLSMLVNGSLILSCEISLMPCTCANSNPIKIQDSQMSSDYEKLFLDEQFSDVLIIDALGGEIPCHKMILSARCEVFNKMFDTKMNETKLGRVDILDVEPVVLMEMIRFLYTGTVPKMAEMGEELLIVADKYLLGSLKSMCEAFLLNKMSFENATETYSLASIHNAEQLKTRALDFIMANYEDLKETADWPYFIEAYPNLSKE